jgi:ABC-type nickel/cobalt efflux system permease component RcnA
MTRVVHALAIVLVVCVGVRVGAALVEPLLPLVATALLISLAALPFVRSRGRL